jgi:hypothetical protein
MQWCAKASVAQAAIDAWGKATGSVLCGKWEAYGVDGGDDYGAYAAVAQSEEWLARTDPSVKLKVVASQGNNGDGDPYFVKFWAYGCDG